MQTQDGTGASRIRIALCHLESVVCLPAINQLFDEFGDQIGLILISNRFSGKQGGAARQFVRGVRRSGLPLTLWLGFDILAAQVLSGIAKIVRPRHSAFRPVRVLARRYGSSVMQTADVNSSDCLDAIRAYRPDVVLVMNFDQILRQPLIGIPLWGVLNIHPSMLPMYRGPCPVFWALVARQDRVGVTLHLIEDTSIDSGPIVHQVVAQLDPERSVAEITAKLFLQGASAVRPALERVARGEGPLCRQPQNPVHYFNFPKAAEVRDARRRGLRFCRFSHLVRLAAATFGIIAVSPDTLERC